jgi:hypothetical protein
MGGSCSRRDVLAPHSVKLAYLFWLHSISTGHAGNELIARLSQCLPNGHFPRIHVTAGQTRRTDRVRRMIGVARGAIIVSQQDGTGQFMSINFHNNAPIAMFINQEKDQF